MSPVYSDVTIRLFSHRSGYRSDLPLRLAIQIRIQIQIHVFPFRTFFHLITVISELITNATCPRVTAYGAKVYSGARATAVNTEKRVECGRDSVGALTWGGARRAYRH